MHPVGIQFTTLLRGPLNTQLGGLLVRLTLHNLLGECFWNVAMEGLGNYRQLCELCKRLEGSGYNIVCEAVELARGKVAEEAQKRGGGIEEEEK